MSFHTPSVWLLLLLAVIPLLVWHWRRRRRTEAILYSSTHLVAAVTPTLAVRLRWLVPALRCLALGLLVVCLARPQKANEYERQRTEGVLIQIVLDRSGSMDTKDFTLERRRVRRLDAVKHVIGQFVGGGGEFAGRTEDLLGLVVFGTYADAVCPITFDHEHVLTAIAQTETSRRDSERGTAIGDALALGVERIRSFEDGQGEESAVRIKSRVMILLTDGQDTESEIHPITAADLAAAFDIKVYTIGAGGRGEVDERTLTAIAERTGGRYFRASSSRTLADVYAQIDALERTEIEQERFATYTEMSVDTVPAGTVSVPPLLLVVFLTLALEQVLASTRWRTQP